MPDTAPEPNAARHPSDAAPATGDLGSTPADATVNAPVPVPLPADAGVETGADSAANKAGSEAGTVAPAAGSDPAPSAPALTPARPRKAARANAGGREGRSARPQGSKQPPQPARKVHPVLQRLFELYPKMFGARFLPLKLGVFQDLLALHPDEFKREDLKVALGLHARSTRYLEAVAAGEKRHDLNAVPVEDVAPEHVHHAILEVFRRRQARTQEDLRPALRQRLVGAIEASGLSREVYAERMRTSDEIANTVLDEACAEVAAKAARREALRRAFETSGRSVDAFAEMYGLDPVEVRQTLESNRPPAQDASRPNQPSAHVQSE